MESSKSLEVSQQVPKGKLILSAVVAVGSCMMSSRYSQERAGFRSMLRWLQP